MISQLKRSGSTYAHIGGRDSPAFARGGKILLAEQKYPGDSVNLWALGPAVAPETKFASKVP